MQYMPDTFFVMMVCWNENKWSVWSWGLSLYKSAIIWTKDSKH